MSVIQRKPSVIVNPGPINRLGSYTVFIRTEWYSKWNLDARYRHYSVQNDIFKCPSIYINSRQRIYVEDCQDWQWASNDGSLDYTWTLTADRLAVNGTVWRDIKDMNVNEIDLSSLSRNEYMTLTGPCIVYLNSGHWFQCQYQYLRCIRLK